VLREVLFPGRRSYLSVSATYGSFHRRKQHGVLEPSAWRASRDIDGSTVESCELKGVTDGAPSMLFRTFSGPEAADLSGITYRQLDYWARRGWVVPARVAGGKVPRRVYTAADIVRLAALGHLGRSRVDVAAYAAATGRLPIPTSDGFVIVWAIDEKAVRVVCARSLRKRTGEPGRYVVFDPTGLLRTLERSRFDGALPRRRTFSDAYKLGVLAEYDQLTGPGAKGALLRREGLHTSHLVAWRRYGTARRTPGAGRPALSGPGAADATTPRVAS
jgi:hypothetical protein